jgi:two-component system, NtrC family, sensor histidine kinase PilS
MSAEGHLLERRLRRLMMLRVVIVTTLLLIAAYVEAVSEQVLNVNPLYFLIAATYVLTGIHAVLLRLLGARPALAYAQVIGDLLVVTGLVYTTGGARTGFMLLYPISVLSGSVVLPRGRGVALAGLAALLYATVIWLVRFGTIPPQGMGDALVLPTKALFFSVFVTAVACGTTAVTSSYLAHSLQTAGEEAADLRKLNEMILNSIQSGLITADTEGRLLYLNAFGEAILGISNAEVRGRYLSEVFASPLLEAAALQARAAYASLARLELAYRSRTAGELELGLSVSWLATVERRRGYLVVFQNLTPFKQLEREVRLKEKLAAVGEMAAQLAHEIRNPLGSISGSAQVLMKEPNMSAEQENLLAIITRESKRLSDTLNQFLFQARTPRLPAEPVDLQPVIQEAVTLLRNGPEVGPGHELRFRAEAGPMVCLADRDQIAQVFWNLARNGLEAMPEGGVLHISLGRTGQDLVLSVRDEGRGIGREEQKRIFEPFHSGGKWGTGLGLAIVYRIVREHRGDIAVRSVPARGTEFEVRLPLVSVPVPA